MLGGRVVAGSGHRTGQKRSICGRVEAESTEHGCALDGGIEKVCEKPFDSVWNR